MIVDDHGILGQVQSDGSIEGGDALNWMCHAWVFNEDFLAKDLKWTPEEFLEVFSAGFGAYIRHPHKFQTNLGFGSYYNGPWDGVISRDQLTGLMCFLIKYKKRKEMFKVFLHASCWLWLFSYNTRDNNWRKTKKWKWPGFTGPDMWSLYLRGMLGWFSVPVNIVFDVHILFAAIWFNMIPSKDPISFTIKSFTSFKSYPSLTSFIAWKLINKDKLKKEITAYWSGFRAMPDFADSYSVVIEENR